MSSKFQQPLDMHLKHQIGLFQSFLGSQLQSQLTRLRHRTRKMQQMQAGQLKHRNSQKQHRSQKSDEG